MTTFNGTITATGDVGFQFLTTWTTGSGCQAGNLSGFVINAGMRFLNVTVPQGSTINSANLTTNTVTINGSPSVVLKAWASDNAGQFASSGNLPGNVTPTTASGAFAITSGLVVNSITSVIQEIVSRGGWVSGNAINIIVLDNSSADSNTISWDGFSGTIPVIDIDYTAGADTTIGGYNQYYSKQIAGIG